MPAMLVLLQLFVFILCADSTTSWRIFQTAKFTTDSWKWQCKPSQQECFSSKQQWTTRSVKSVRQILQYLFLKNACFKINPISWYHRLEHVRTKLQPQDEKIQNNFDRTSDMFNDVQQILESEIRTQTRWKSVAKSLGMHNKVQEFAVEHIWTWKYQPTQYAWEAIWTQSQRAHKSRTRTNEINAHYFSLFFRSKVEKLWQVARFSLPL